MIMQHSKTFKINTVFSLGALKVILVFSCFYLLDLDETHILKYISQNLFYPSLNPYKVKDCARVGVSHVFHRVWIICHIRDLQPITQALCSLRVFTCFLVRKKETKQPFIFVIRPNLLKKQSGFSSEFLFNECLDIFTGKHENCNKIIFAIPYGEWRWRNYTIKQGHLL